MAIVIRMNDYNYFIDFGNYVHVNVIKLWLLQWRIQWLFVPLGMLVVKFEWKWTRENWVKRLMRESERARERQTDRANWRKWGCFGIYLVKLENYVCRLLSQEEKIFTFATNAVNHVSDAYTFDGLLTDWTNQCGGTIVFQLRDE